MKRRPFLVLCGALSLSPLALSSRALAQQAPEKEVLHEPRGIYARIDLRSTDDMTARLAATYGTDRRDAIQEVLARPTAFAPPVLYALANALGEAQPEPAIFWYHVGRVRAVYDALRCRDKTARAGLIFLRRQLSQDLVRLLATRPERLVRQLHQAVEWDAVNPQDYDHRWIALFGKVSRTSNGDDSNEVTVPESQWPAIRKYVYEAHLKSVKGFVDQKRVQ